MTDIPMEPSEPVPTEPPVTPPPPPTLSERLGGRATRRMTPRLGVAIAGAGAVLAVAGATGLGGDQLVGDDGDVQRIPGILLSAIVIAVGYAVVAQLRTGALAAAGSTAAALGIPVLLFFLTFSEDDFPPFSVDGVLLLSSLAWLAIYFIGPAAGRLLFLGAALLGSWLFVMNLVEPIDQVSPLGFFAPTFDSESSFESSDDFGMELDEDGNVVFPEESEDLFEDEDAFSFEPPSFTNLGVVSLLFGAAYATAGLVLSRRGLFGVGTAFAATSLAALVTALQLLTPELEQIGTGLLAIVLGLGLAAIGAATSRRVTTWVGGAGVALGASVLLQEAIEDGSASAQSAAFLVLGVALAVVGELLANAVGEPDEELEQPTFAETWRGPGASPALEEDPSA